MADKKSFVMYENWSRLIYDMPDEQAVKLVKKICGYVIGEETPNDPVIDAIFNMIRITLDADSQKYEEICKKRSEARKRNVDKSQQKSTSVNKCQQVCTDNENDNDNDNVPKGNKKNISKKKHGEFDNVLLTEEEFEKLKAKFPADYEKRINALSGYIASKGTKYKSHYATILNWSRNERASPTKVNNFKAHTQQTYDFDELEKKLISNG